MAIKKTKPVDIKTKEFNIVLPFKIKDDSTEGEDKDIITIEGYASFCGDDSGEGKNAFVDTAGDVVNVAGIDLKWFKANPIMLFQHQRDYAIGQAIDIVKKKDGLYVTSEIHREAMKPEDWYKIKSGIIKQFSIGFRCSKVEYKTVADKEICFIIKSVLYEISCVSIACNQMSGYQVMKAYEDGSFTTEFFSDTTDNDSKSQNKEGGDTMKIKLADKYSATEIEKLVKLGLVSDADAEIEVNTKEYIDLLVLEKFETFKADFKAELKAEADAITKAAEDKLALEKKEAEDKAKAELAEKLSITVEDLEKMTEDEIEDKVKTLESTNEEEEFTADELLALKELAADSNAYLKSLLAEE